MLMLRVEEQWYVAILIVQCRVEGHSSRLKLVDEQIKVLAAPDIDTAYAKAVKLGQSEECSYVNVYGEQVYWEFVGLADLRYLGSDRPEDGVEILSNLSRKKDPTRLVKPKDQLTVFEWESERKARDANSLRKRDGTGL
jgi:hypothetical protein